MIRFRLTELLAERSFRAGRRIEWQEVAEQTGVHKATLSRMLNVRGYNASLSSIDSLCRYFDCAVGDLLIYVPDSDITGPIQKSFRGPKPAVARPQADELTRKKASKAD